MMLRIGNRRAGFTLVEVIIATAVLSLGSVLIYEAFFMCMDSFNYCSDYLNIASWVDEKIWQTQQSLTLTGGFDELEQNGDITKQKNRFRWQLSHSLISTSLLMDIYEIGLTLSWQQGKRVARTSRNAYIVYEKE